MNAEFMKKIGFHKGNNVDPRRCTINNPNWNGFKKGNTKWDNPKSKRHWFPKGKNHPDYRWCNLDELSEINLMKFDREMLNRDYHQGKINSNPSILFSNEWPKDERKHYLKELIYSEQNPNFLRHLKIVNDFKELRDKKRICKGFFNGKWVVFKRRRSKCKATKIIKKENPEIYKQYRISLVCVNQYNRFFGGIWKPQKLIQERNRKINMIEQKKIIKKHMDIIESNSQSISEG
jgi:hypothetical protein